MPTYYSKIYDKAIFRFNDYSFLKLNLTDRESILETYLHSAIVDFQKVCRIDLKDRDETKKQFNLTLDDECIEILSLGLVYYWLSSYVLSSELLKNNLSTKDYSYYSPANLLKELQELRKSLYKEFRSKIVEYSYYSGNVSSLKV